MILHSKLAPAVASLLIAGCTGEGPTAGERYDLDLLSIQPTVPGAIPDLGGNWDWTRDAQLTFPAWVAQVLGIQPEGPTTSATCQVSGVMTVVQTGAAFTGTYGITAGTCETKGGQIFPSMAGPPDPMAGRITGNALRLTTDGFLLDCELHAVVTDFQGAVAVALRGGGRCIVPGHPRSEVPGFDPPPAGTEVLRSWIAVRP